MKAKICLLIVVLFVASIANAQNDSKKKKSSSMDLSGLMGQVISGMKSSSFTDGKAGKNEVLGMLSGIDASDYLKYASVAGSLAGALKSTSFLPGWATQKDGVLDKLQQAGSIADVAGGMSGLVGNLNPSSMSKGLKGNLGTISTALGILSMIK